MVNPSRMIAFDPSVLKAWLTLFPEIIRLPGPDVLVTVNAPEELLDVITSAPDVRMMRHTPFGQAPRAKVMTSSCGVEFAAVTAARTLPAPLSVVTVTV